MAKARTAKAMKGVTNALRSATRAAAAGARKTMKRGTMGVPPPPSTAFLKEDRDTLLSRRRKRQMGKKKRGG